MTRVMISCGEASGDLYAGALARELRALQPDIDIAGFGGERLAAAGVRLIGDYRGISVTGLAEALAVIPRSWRMYRALVDAARRRPPDVFVAIDFPDFNFRVARALKALGIPIVYYIPPQLWAWRAGRLRTLAALADQVLVIFPFEERIYQEAGIPVQFVGHPMLDLVGATESPQAAREALGLDPHRLTIALLPGSRPNELRQILPDLRDGARLLQEARPEAQFVLARAPHLDDRLFGLLGDGRGPAVRVVEGQTDRVVSAADVVLTASGTATVQAAIHRRPMVIVYRLSPLTYSIGKPFVRVTTYGMVNLIAGSPIMPELIQRDLTPRAVADAALRFLTDASYAARARAGLEEVRAKLGGEGASRRAAETVAAMAARR